MLENGSDQKRIINSDLGKKIIVCVYNRVKRVLINEPCDQKHSVTLVLKLFSK